jgi:hypothetical protein
MVSVASKLSTTEERCQDLNLSNYEVNKMPFKRKSNKLCMFALQEEHSLKLCLVTSLA